MLRLSWSISIRYPEGILVLRLTISKVKVLAVIGVHTAAPRAELLLSLAVRSVIYAEPNAISTILFHVPSPSSFTSNDNLAHIAPHLVISPLECQSFAVKTACSLCVTAHKFLTSKLVRSPSR